VPISSRDIPRMADSDLLGRVNQRLGQSTFLQPIFDSDFVARLVDKKRDTDNYLLWLLASDHPAAVALISRVNTSLEILSDENATECFGTKFRESYGGVVLTGNFVHLLLASMYKERGFDITLEPRVRDGNCDFSASSGSTVFFEVKSLRDAELGEQQRIVDGLWNRFEGSPYVLSFSVSFEGESLPNVGEMNRFFDRRLRELRLQTITFPISIEYADTKRNSVTLHVYSVTDGHGGVMSFSHGVRGGVTSESIRKKLRKATPQLPSDSPSVIVATGTRTEIDEFSLKQALYGDVAVQFQVNHVHHESRPLGSRSLRNGFFHSNRKVSAVCFAEIQLIDSGATLNVNAYHNPITRNTISRDTFRTIGARQFGVASQDSTGYDMAWLPD
jgi:hypothetical protein